MQLPDVEILGASTDFPGYVTLKGTWGATDTATVPSLLLWSGYFAAKVHFREISYFMFSTTNGKHDE